MIRVSVEPSLLVAGRRERLSVRVGNDGQGPCSNVVFRLELPSGMSLIEGRSRVEVPSIPGGREHVHEITVEPQQAGQFEVRSVSFSYRDEYGVPAYPGDFRCRLSVASAPVVKARPPRPVPVLGVRLENGDTAFPLGEFGDMKILVQNSSDVAIQDVIVTVNGPLQINRNRSRTPVLLPGAKARFTFSVMAATGGRVPVTTHATFSYPDEYDRVRQAAQEDSLRLLVRQEPMKTARPAGKVETILFLGASPQDLPPIHPDRDLETIRRELRFDGNQDRFRLEWSIAAQQTDINRELVQYKPHVVQFSGHGEEDGRLYVEDGNGYSKPVKPDGLAGMFGLYSSTIRCVVVNACHSQELARITSQHTHYAIGMRTEIGDAAATLFGVAFYQSLLRGEEVPKAFAAGCLQLQMDEGAHREHLTPVLYVDGRPYSAPQG